MKNEMIAVIGLLCEMSLFAQSFNTTYCALNGQNLHHSITTLLGKGAIVNTAT